MIKRRYIRIEEIEQKTPFTKGDILELVERGDLSFSANVKSDTMGAVHTNDGTRYVYGVFRYEGIVGLTKEASKSFAESDKPQQVSLVMIKHPENILGWGTVEEKFGKVEHDRTPYIPTSINKPERMIWAYPQVGVGKSGLQMFNNMTVMLSKVAGTYDQNSNDIKEDQKDYFRSGKLTVTSDALRVDLEDLNRLIEKLETSLEKAHVTSHSPNIETHPIKQIIERIISNNFEYSSSTIWNLLRKEFESDLKQFDIDEVIFEITQDDLSYFGQGDVTKTITYRRFQNLISEVRKNLHG
ncbi:hypothetical protein [Vibrio sp. S12_S33]|uniref:hypothetical protein n=1 Tax=Vibrio sp. S12_S33 TaxID=2720223 RepID=UPI001783F644|nr:hypothetical protein [Vibrio sp. S12_S33]MBD1565644.1 hypothetical protein [Vibrio sp. S12_S33]